MYKNFTKVIESSIINMQFYRTMIKDAIKTFETINAASPNKESLLNIIESNKANLIGEKSKFMNKFNILIH